MGSVFSASNLLEANFAKPTTVDKINVEESYFVACLNYLEEMDKEMSTSSKVLYKSILESGDDVIAINESFSSFCESIKKIIEKFLDFLKKIVQKFILTINKLVKSEKYITKHKADIKKFGPNDNFEMNVYIFTNLTNDDVPMLNPEDEWDRSHGMAAKNDATATLLAQTTSVYNNLKKDLDGGWYDGFRGRVIGKSSVSSEDFADELFEIFRNNSKEKTKEEFSYDKIIDSLNRFEGYSENLKTVTNNKKELEKGYNKIKKEIESWSKAGTDGKTGLNVVFGDSSSQYKSEYDEHKKEVDEQVDLFIKAKVAQIDHMCKIHSMAFTAKLDAIKACFTQDKAILYKALSKTTKVIHKESYESGERGEEVYGLFDL